MPLTLKTRASFPTRVDASPLLPELWQDRQLGEIERTPVLLGNRQVSVGELFQVSGSPDDGILRIEGELARLDRVGRAMSRGRIEVHGSPAHECGAEISGGTLVIHGDVRHYLGTQQRGGMIAVTGSAGDNLGGCYPSCLRGQRGGTILVADNAGHGVGQYQRRGLIVVAGNAGDDAALAQRAGTVVIGGNVGDRCAYDQRRGTIVVLDQMTKAWSASGRFTPGYRGRPVMLELLARTIRREADAAGLSLSAAFLQKLATSSLQLWHGDALELNRGEVWLGNVG